MKDIYDILAKHFAGEATASESAMVDQWKSDHAAEYDDLSRAWNAVPDSFVTDASFTLFDHHTALQKIESRLKPEKIASKVFGLNTAMKYSIAAAITVLIGFSAIWFINSSGSVTVTNEMAGAKEIKLPDGSLVWLGSGSTLTYDSDFSDSRKMSLEGEAFFEVEPDTSRPFEVTTDFGSVRVLGTAFNVETVNGLTEVSVDHGLVAFRNGEEEVKLSAGQSAVSEKNGVSEIASVDVNFLSWKSGEFHFENTSLEEVIDEMNKFYPETITFDRATTRDLRITGDFNNRPVEELIEVIVLTCGLEAEYGDGTIRLD